MGRKAEEWDFEVKVSFQYNSWDELCKADPEKARKLLTAKNSLKDHIAEEIFENHMAELREAGYAV